MTPTSSRGGRSEPRRSTTGPAEDSANRNPTAEPDPRDRIENMRTYRYKSQTSDFGLFLGITAEATRLDAAPNIGKKLSDRVWLDTSQVHNAYRGEPLTLSEREAAWLEFGLLKVTSSIEAQATGHVRTRRAHGTDRTLPRRHPWRPEGP